MPFHTIDLSLIILYFCVVLGIGAFVALRERREAKGKEVSAEEYFLAGKSLKWPSIGFSLFASNISSATLIGLAGAAYSTGISISNYEWAAAVVLVFFVIFFVPYYINTNIFTMPEFLEKRFNSNTRYYFSALTVIGNVFIDTAATLFAGSLVIKFFFPTIEFWQSATFLAIVAGLYTAAGGLAAVVYTDVIQAVILIVGSTVITFLALDKVGGWDAVVVATPPEMLSVIRPASDPTMPWTGLLIGVPILGFYFWGTNQFIVQRVLGAKNTQHARWGSLFGGLLKLPVLFIMVYPGVMARMLFPDLETPDLVFPTLVSELLPVGLKGLVLAGLVAAIMSSIDSTLHSASTLVTMDFVKKLNPEIQKRQLTSIGRKVTVIFMVIAILWVPVVAKFETLFGYLQNALAYLVPPVVAVFMLGLFWKRATSKGAFYGLLAGHAVSLVTFVSLSFEWIKGIHFLELAGVFMAVSVVVIVAVSLLDSKPDHANKQEFVWSKQRYAAENESVALWQDYRLHCAIILFLTAWLVVANW